MRDYPKQQLQELFEILPKVLQDALLSTEIGSKVFDICEGNGIEETETAEEVLKYTSYVLIGLLPPNELRQTLKKELNLSEDLAKQVAWEISRFVFLPLEESLESLYKIEIEESKPKVVIPPGEEAPTQSQKEKTEAEREKDVYREPIK